MIPIPQELLAIIKREIRRRSARGEEGYVSGELEEDTMVGDFLGNLRIEKREIVTTHSIYDWKIEYKKFQGRGPNAYEKISGADGIITFEITDKTTDLRTVKSIIFQAKKDTGKQGLIEQQKNMERIAPKGHFTFRMTPDGYYAENNTALKRQRIGDFLADEFLACHTGIEGMTYDRIRRELKFDELSLIHYNIANRLTIEVEKIRDF